MATWMTHLRIADQLLDRIPDLAPIEFIMGNLAPDSGVPTEAGFSPPVSQSHVRLDDGTGKKVIALEAYRTQYFSPALIAGYTPQQYAFYLGYYVHLLTDVFWSDRVAWPACQQFPDASWDDIKADWHEVDFLYLKERPGFRAFRAYLGSVGFVNRYLDIFPADAFENRREFITSYYLNSIPDPAHSFSFFTPAQAEGFVADCTAHLMEVLA